MPGCVKNKYPKIKNVIFDRPPYFPKYFVVFPLGGMNKK
jgi:hypothetical protein